MQEMTKLLNLQQVGSVEELEKALQHIKNEIHGLHVAGREIKEHQLDRMLRRIIPRDMRVLKESLDNMVDKSWTQLMEYTEKVVIRTLSNKISKTQVDHFGNLGDIENEGDEVDGYEGEPQDDDEEAHYGGYGKGGGIGKGKGRGRGRQPQRFTRFNNNYGDGEYLAKIQKDKQEAESLREALEEIKRLKLELKKARDEDARKSLELKNQDEVRSPSEAA